MNNLQDVREYNKENHIPTRRMSKRFTPQEVKELMLFKNEYLGR